MIWNYKIITRDDHRPSPFELNPSTTWFNICYESFSGASNYFSIYKETNRKVGLYSAWLREHGILNDYDYIRYSTGIIDIVIDDSELAIKFKLAFL